MKIQALLSAAVLCCTIAIVSSCKNDSAAAKGATVENGIIQPATDTASASTPPATPPTTEPAQNAQGVWHYTCTKGCAGGAGAAIACAKCGTTLIHNKEYHSQAGANPNPSAAPGQTPGAAPAAKQPEPAQNAAGVWHYTCAAGCAGGAGAAIACAKCGATLTHNKNYHSN